MTYKITQTPIPAGPEPFPLDELEIGDSFEVPRNRAIALRTAASNKALNSTRPAHQGPVWNYTTRKQPDGSLRIWRIA